jgi:hypothetical protein
MQSAVLIVVDPDSDPHLFAGSGSVSVPFQANKKVDKLHFFPENLKFQYSVHNIEK